LSWVSTVLRPGPAGYWGTGLLGVLLILCFVQFAYFRNRDGDESLLLALAIVQTACICSLPFILPRFLALRGYAFSGAPPIRFFGRASLVLGALELPALFLYSVLPSSRAGFRAPLTAVTIGIYILFTAGMLYTSIVLIAAKPPPDMGRKERAARRAFGILCLLLFPLLLISYWFRHLLDPGADTDSFLLPYLVMAAFYGLHSILELSFAVPMLRSAFAVPDEVGGERGSLRPAEGREPFSRRELEVADLLARGRTYGEIGDALCISPLTVQTHAKRIYRKAGCRNKTELGDRIRGIPR
jgi:DNA-binding CsgD family transcriptional regulator